VSPATVLRDLDRVVAAAEPQQRLGLALALNARVATLAADMAAEPSAPSAHESPAAEAKERWLAVDEALAVLGNKVNRKFLYRATRGMKFRKDLSRKNVLWEEAGLRRWIASRRS
jgi:hypothetical protein